jgi:hypothetical protein
LTATDPVEIVTVMLVPAGITTSSDELGNPPALQLDAALQSPLPPIHVTVAAEPTAGPKAATRAMLATRLLRMNFRVRISCFIMAAC